MADKESRAKEEHNIKTKIRNNLLERRNEAKIIRRIVAVIVLILIIGAGGAGYAGYTYVHSALKPVDPDNKKQVEIDVPIGSSTTAIGKLLKKKGIIKDATIFKYYVKLNNISGFQAGSYAMAPSMTLDEITATLQTGKVIQEAVVKITIPEGLNLQQIAGVLAKHIDMSVEDIMEKLDDPELIEKLMGKHPDLFSEEILNEQIKHPLEGYLFPATYSFQEENPTLESILDKMLNQTKLILSKYADTIAEKEQDVHKLLTLASLIEKEATEKADRHVISSVFYNRMKIEPQMPLQTDPTVLYALGSSQGQGLV